MSYTINIDEAAFNDWYRENYGELFDPVHMTNPDMVLIAYVARRTIMRCHRAEETIADMRIFESALVNGLKEYSDKVYGLYGDLGEVFADEYKRAEKLISAAS